MVGGNQVAEPHPANFKKKVAAEEQTLWFEFCKDGLILSVCTSQSWRCVLDAYVSCTRSVLDQLDSKKLLHFE